MPVDPVAVAYPEQLDPKWQLHVNQSDVLVGLGLLAVGSGLGPYSVGDLRML